MKVVIFCGGYGVRMGEETRTIPKPMIEIGGKPILWHIMRYYSAWGHNEFILCLGYKGEVVKRFFLSYDGAMVNDFVLDRSSNGTKLELLSKIFEVRASTGFISLLGQADDYMKTLAEVQNKGPGFPGTVERAQLEGVAGGWAKLSGSIKAVGLDLYELVKGPLAATLHGFADALTLASSPKGKTGSILGGAIGGGLILSLTILFRNRPADLGLTPYGAAADDPPAVVRSPALERLRRQVFTRHMRRTRAFWSLPLIHGLGCAGHGIVLLYAVPMAVERGLTLVSASVILSLIAACSIGSRLLTPIVAERWGGKPIIAAALVIQGCTVPVLWGAHEAWTFYLFGSLFGIGFGGEMTAYLVVNRQYFGTGPTGTLYGFEMMGALLGHAVASGLAGLVLYATGSFWLVLLLSMSFSLVGVGVILRLESTARMLIPHWEAAVPPDAHARPTHAPP